MKHARGNLFAVSAAFLFLGLTLGACSGEDRAPGTQADGDLDLETFVQLTSDGRYIGPENAEIVILLYTDFACGPCIQLHATLATLMRRYPQYLATVVKFWGTPDVERYHNALMGTECAAEQSRFKEYYDAGFGHRLVNFSDGWITIADSAGVPDMAEFRACVRAKRPAEKLEAQYQEGFRLGVFGVPTFFVNGRRFFGSMELPALDSIIVSEFPDRNGLEQNPG
jgi:protein-disulfide isomerase